MLWMGDERGTCVFLNAALRAFWGINPARLDEFDWSSTLHPDDIDMLAGPFAAAMAAHTPFVVEARYKRADGIYRTMRTEANPRFSPAGAFLGMTGVNTDISDQLAAEAHSRYLMGELNHRTKNILAVVQALARQTSKDVPPQEFQQEFDRRLRGLAASNDLLLKNDWAGVLLEDLVAAQLAYLPDPLGARIASHGPQVRIPARGAQTLGMALHELSTNSLKYGALADAAGHVDLNWNVRPDGGWTIEWREHNPRPVAAPERRGFGTRVLTDMIRSTFNAEVEMTFASPGLAWRAIVPAEA